MHSVSPQLMKKLPNLDEKNKEKPLCFVYSVKARALLHAHFSRLELPPNSLDVGRYNTDILAKSFLPELNLNFFITRFVITRFWI